jgi:hypothetical protein
MGPRKIRSVGIKRTHQDKKIRTRLNVTLYLHFLSCSHMSVPGVILTLVMDSSPSTARGGCFIRMILSNTISMLCNKLGD